MTAISAVGLSLIACSASQQKTAEYGLGGAALGAVAGAAVSGGDGNAARRGAAIGAVAGASVANQPPVAPGVVAQYPGAVAQYPGVSGAYQGGNAVVVHQPLCTYQDRRGRLYQAPCPQMIQRPRLCIFTDVTGALYQAPCNRHPH